MSYIPINIRPHLVPFLYQEFEGREAVYLGKKVSSIKIGADSSLGRSMRLYTVKADFPKRSEYYNIYLTLEELPDGKKKYEGNYFRMESGKKSFLQFTPEATTEINNLLEDIFRISFVYFVDGYTKHPDASVKSAIDYFIDKYDLLEFGFSNESMRQLYYREKGTKLDRLKEQSANRVTNYKKP
ncbi:hypothetical protein [Flavobacterium psychrotrophum]|uniref:hypothetical protein n=1 Tax=Flavobacterium psychrotrophum TaxID=2294119 RepID=UPI000E3225A9|nr:hypothetical protein [Flavobacterium psychrotrophum]